MELVLGQQRQILRQIARRVMVERGLLPDFSDAARAELSKINSGGAENDGNIRDLTDLLWASIDNDDSRDLDQLTYAEVLPGEKTKIFIAVADVDSLVKVGTAIDQHARVNTTSVYTIGTVFPMLPEHLSNDLTSLNYDEERRAIVVEIEIDADGKTQSSDIYRARVRNHAKLAYDSVAEWLDGTGEMPVALAKVKGLAENIRIQDAAAKKMKKFRHDHGALDFTTIKAKPIFDGDELRDLQDDRPNTAKSIIEDFMIAANGVTARYLSSKQFPSLRRVVRVPKRWERIVGVAAEQGFKLPSAPNSLALAAFLSKEKATNPLTFPDISLAIIKLLGSGEYVAESPGETSPGHFGLAVRDYTHSTAPNRRYPDLITQRLLKAAMRNEQVPYSKNELESLADHCTKAEDNANKVERQVTKSAAAMLLESRIGEQFDAIVTGSGPKGTWARLFNPPVEGKLSNVTEDIDVGHRIRVQLTHVDVERGFIDFKRI
jgi:VacB/RNase II family 3'-5' exoribonuclease